MNIVNISAYKFVTLDPETLPQMREDFKNQCLSLPLKGTIILSPEGINLFLAAEREVIDNILAYIRAYPQFADIWAKESYSDNQPFNRMLVKLKKETIPMGDPDVVPEQFTAPYISAEELCQWYDQGKEFYILDTRNDYEIRLGSFDNALDLNIENFREFDDELKQIADLKDKPIVTFCTGGIRCEKAAPLMLKKGFKNVYQLHGGIINYFEKIGGKHYHGDCFVFDQRVALNANLEETETTQCYACLNPLTKEEQQDSRYVIGVTCPYCFDEKQNENAA